MQNLNQIRARHVLQFSEFQQGLKGKNGGEVIKKIPPVIMNNGLLSALAYSLDKNNAAWKTVFDGIAAHVASEEVAKVPPDRTTAEALLDYLVSPDSSSALLRDVTAEAAAWLDFARRLVK